MDQWNNAKRAEEKDRVKHSLWRADEGYDGIITKGGDD